tara:strand:+ start:155 stop:322 length:168 start_codon:yes stop_codon:yes gene_type:complete
MIPDKNWADKERKKQHNLFFEMMGYKPRRKKNSHQWWESPWIDYDDPRNCYYEKQ